MGAFGPASSLLVSIFFVGQHLAECFRGGGFAGRYCCRVAQVPTGSWLCPTSDGRRNT
jgi:hypothetical protein